MPENCCDKWLIHAAAGLDGDARKVGQSMIRAMVRPPRGPAERRYQAGVRADFCCPGPAYSG